MKYLSILIFFILSTTKLFASNVTANQFYQCSYQIRELITMNINGFASPKYITYTSRMSNGPITIYIDDFKEDSTAGMVTYYGDLPSPWAEGTTFEIEVRDMFSSTFRVTGPEMPNGNRGHTVAIPMACR